MFPLSHDSFGRGPQVVAPVILAFFLTRNLGPGLRCGWLKFTSPAPRSGTSAHWGLTPPRHHVGEAGCHLRFLRALISAPEKG